MLSASLQGMFGNAKQVAFQIGQSGPLHVGDFVQDVPLIGGTEADETVYLGLSCSPWDGQVQVDRLAFGAGLGHGLEEHAEAPGACRWQVNTVSTGCGRGTGHGCPKFCKPGRVLGLQIDGTEGDLIRR